MRITGTDDKIKIFLFILIPIILFLPQIIFTFPRNYNILHIKLQLSFNLKNRSFSAEENLKLTPLCDNFTALNLHAKNMSIKSVTFSDGQKLSFSYDSSKLSISLPEKFSTRDTLTFIIRYFSIPEKGIYFMPVRTKEFASLQIYSHSEPVDARYWFPCYDAPEEKVTSEIIATVPDSFFVLSNGRLLKKFHDSRTSATTFHWLQDKPHSIYLISFAAGKYTEIRDHSGNTPVYYYVYPHQRELAKFSFAKTPKMIRFFEDTFNYPFPWDKYAQIITHKYPAGGMEHTTATTLTDRTIHDARAHLDRDSDELVSHELSHQWFGDLITCKNWRDLWLNEGFATYSEILFTEFDKGKDEADYALYNDLQFYLDMADENFPHPIVYDGFHSPDDMFNFIEYQKAALVLHQLRQIIGDNSFFDILHQFLHRFAFQSVVTEDFQRIAEEISRQDLGWFFQQWLYRGGHPKLKVMREYRPEDKKLYLYVEQTQEDSAGVIPLAFRLPVKVELIGKNLSATEKILIHSRRDTFAIPFPKRPLAIRFDKSNYLIKDFQMVQSEDEWLYLAQNDPTVPGRLRAIEEITDEVLDTVKVAATLEKIAISDPFRAVREEAIYYLRDFSSPNTPGVLVQACKDKNSGVRRAAVNALGSYYDKKYNPIFRKIARTDSSYHVIEAALFALSNVKDDSTFDFVSQFVNMDSDNDIIRTAAFYVLDFLDDEQSIPIAMQFASDTTNSPYIRSLALGLFRKVGVGKPEVESFLIKALAEKNKIVLKKAIDVLGSFKNRRVLAALENMKKKKNPSDVEHKIDFSIRRIESALKRK